MQMKVILNKDIPNLGEEGDVISVAGGYARNYLIPNQLAVVHSKISVASFESRRAAIEKRKDEKLDQARGLKEKIEALTLIIPMPAGNSGRLFGSVGNANIAEELEKQGISVERKRIDILGHTLKEVGKFPVTIKLYGGESAELTIEITGVAAGAKTPATEPAAPRKRADEPSEEKVEEEKSSAPEAKEEEQSAAVEDEVAESEVSDPDESSEKGTEEE